jgi:hypothetical protein
MFGNLSPPGEVLQAEFRRNFHFPGPACCSKVLGPYLRDNNFTFGVHSREDHAFTRDYSRLS